MEEQIVLYKGELMEERLRNYFLDIGYYVVRGIKYRYDKNDVTDVDLFLYNRNSSLTRERINVDIKNKKSPQAFERILWANGLKSLLNFESCIVATSDTRNTVHAFGQEHKTIILDGSFIKKLRSDEYTSRLKEEELLEIFSNFEANKTFDNRNWRYVYELSKSKLLAEQDFSGFNSILTYLHYFFEQLLLFKEKRSAALRMIYVMVSHLLIIIDYIIKDIAFLDQQVRERKLINGFRYGNLGKTGGDKILNIAAAISGKPIQNLYNAIEDSNAGSLTEFFLKNENNKKLFIWAKDFETLGFSKNLIAHYDLPASAKGFIALLIDYFEFNRSAFFDSKLPSQTVDENKLNIRITTKSEQDHDTKSDLQNSKEKQETKQDYSSNLEDEGKDSIQVTESIIQSNIDNKSEKG